MKKNLKIGYVVSEDYGSPTFVANDMETLRAIMERVGELEIFFRPESDVRLLKAGSPGGDDPVYAVGFHVNTKKPGPYSPFQLAPDRQNIYLSHADLEQRKKEVDRWCAEAVEGGVQRFESLKDLYDAFGVPNRLERPGQEPGQGR